MDEVCASVIAVPLDLPAGAAVQWTLDGVPFSGEAEANVELDPSTVADLTLEVEHDEQVSESTQTLVRSDVIDGEGENLGTGYVVISNARNVVTVAQCQDRLLKVAIIGGCFTPRQPMNVWMTLPQSAPPQSMTDFQSPARFDPRTPSLTLGDWTGGRVQAGSLSIDMNATWSPVSQGDRLELAAPASTTTRWVLVNAPDAVHTDAIGVRCENRRYEVALSAVAPTWVEQ